MLGIFLPPRLARLQTRPEQVDVIELLVEETVEISWFRFVLPAKMN
jgi:hypothetical protein